MILVEVLVPMTVFATIFGVLYVFFTTRNKERLAMIEKGADPSIFANRTSRLGIKIGLLAMGVALGILFGQLIAHLTQMDLEPATMSMIFLCAGSGLVFDHFLAKKSK
jgi:threonine dehydrogenase-like Zn-dependent dehydrogenase